MGQQRKYEQLLLLLDQDEARGLLFRSAGFTVEEATALYEVLAAFSAKGKGARYPLQRPPRADYFTELYVKGTQQDLQQAVEVIARE